MTFKRALTLVLVLGAGSVACRERFRELKKLEPVSQSSLRTFIVLVEERGEPHLISLANEIRLHRGNAVQLRPGQEALTSADAFAQAAPRFAEDSAHGIDATVSDGVISLTVYNDDFTYVSRYAVRDGTTIIPLEEADVTKADGVQALGSGIQAAVMMRLALAFFFLIRRRFASSLDLISTRSP